MSTGGMCVMWVMRAWQWEMVVARPDYHLPMHLFTATLSIAFLCMHPQGSTCLDGHICVDGAHCVGCGNVGQPCCEDGACGDELECTPHQQSTGQTAAAALAYVC